MITGLFRLFFRSFIFFSLLVILAVSGAFVWFQHIWHQPIALTGDRFLVIAKGTSHNQFARQLTQDGYLPKQWYYQAFRFGFTLTQQHSLRLKAGEFAVPAGASYADLFNVIDQAVPYQHRLAIIEGTTARDIVIALQKDDRLSGAILRIPEEGSLAPDTYFFVRDTNRADLIARMQARQEIILAEEWANRSTAARYQSPEEALIMASIIEKESGLALEQPLVASVFLNRIEKQMRLQSDATVLYGIIEEEGRSREVLRSDIETDSAWNTYRRAGYPKSAIANPSRTAINAALNPMPSRYLYFVADGQGGHKFAKTYEEHKKNVAAYRRIKAQSAKD